MASVKYEKICSNKDNCYTKEEDHFYKMLLLLQGNVFIRF